MRCQENSRKSPKCNCCDLCTEVQNAKKENPASDSVSLGTINESYLKNFAIPDDLYYCKENLNKVKSYNERAFQILNDLRQRVCRILENSDCIGPSEDDEDEEEALKELEQRILHKRKQQLLAQQQHSKLHQSQLQHQKQHSKLHQSHMQQQPCSQQQQSHLEQQQHSQQHQSQLQHQKQHSKLHQSHMQQQPCSQKQQSHLEQQQHSQQHQSQLQLQLCSQQQEQHSKLHQSHLQLQPCSQQQEQHSKLHQSHLQLQPCSQQQQSHLQHSQQQSHQHKQHQSNQQIQEGDLQGHCNSNIYGKGKLQVRAPCERIQTIGYQPQSNFLKKMKRRTDVRPNTTSGPLIQCGCANCVPDVVRYQTQVICPCCRCTPVSYGVQSLPCGRFRSGPYSDISSMHDPCTCFRTWRPGPCAGHFPDYQYEILHREGEIYAGEAYFQEYLNDTYDSCDDQIPSKRKGKSGHVSRVDKRKRRRGRRKFKPQSNEKDCVPPDTDFSPSLKRPHPNSCERCWRYASPSRSPVNRPNQRFDPNYRRSHSEVNINSESRGNISKSGSRYSSTNCVDFDPEAKVHEVMSSADRVLKRIKSADCVRKSNLVRPASPKPCERTPKTKDDAEMRRLKKQESDMPSTQKAGSKNRRNYCSSAERSREILRDDRQNPMPCSPSMFDKKSQRSNSKQTAINRLSGSESCKENIKIKPRPSSACQIQTSEDYFDKPRAQSFDRNHLKENLCTSPERMRKCYCTIPRTRTVNMNVMCDQPLFYRSGRDCFPEVKNSFGISNNQENLLGFGKSCLGQDGTKAFFDIHPCVCSFKDLPQPEFRGMTCCCCQDAPLTLWDRKVVSKDEYENDTKRKEGKQRDKNRKGEENNPRKYCVFYMNKSEENEKDEVEVLIEELTAGRKGKDSESDSLKNRMKKMQEPRSESMALRFQKGIADKCRKRENNGVLYF